MALSLLTSDLLFCVLCGKLFFGALLVNQDGASASHDCTTPARASAEIGSNAWFHLPPALAQPLLSNHRDPTAGRNIRRGSPKIRLYFPRF
jgi:hypothetical protein